MPKGLKTLVIVLAIIILVLLGVLVFAPSAKGPTVAPGPGAASGPAVSADGRLTVISPLADSLVVSPVPVAGTVTGGGWFFEATFPVTVEDADGAVLGRGQARAQTDWMSTGTVPFTGSIEFAATSYATGTIVFAKDNPSGLPENAGELRVPVRFR